MPILVAKSSSSVLGAKARDVPADTVCSSCIGRVCVQCSFTASPRTSATTSMMTNSCGCDGLPPRCWVGAISTLTSWSRLVSGRRSSVAMTKAKSSYKSRIAEAIHETMRGAHKVGVIDKRTMREFDVLCLRTVEELSPGEIRALRERERASQAVFASYLNVTTNLVSKWERGQKRPSGAALKLLSIVKAKGLEALA